MAFFQTWFDFFSQEISGNPVLRGCLIYAALVSQTEKRGSCRRDIVRDKEIFGVTRVKKLRRVTAFH